MPNKERHNITYEGHSETQMGQFSWILIAPARKSSPDTFAYVSYSDVLSTPPQIIVNSIICSIAYLSSIKVKRLHITGPLAKNPMMTSSNGNIFRVTGHLCGEFTGPRWIPRTKASNAELWCLICVWINDWVNNREAGDLRRYRAHYDVSVMIGGFSS